MIKQKERARRPWRKLILAVFFALGLLLAACSANEKVIYGDSVPSGTTIKNNLILTGTDVRVEGDVDGDVIAAGRKISVDGDVGGNLYLVGETAAINGTVGGNVYSAAADLSVGPKSSIGKSLFFAGAGLKTDRGSTIGWDLFTMSLGATLAGDVSGKTRAVIGPVELVNIILEQLGTRFDLPNLPRLFPSRQSSLPQNQGSVVAQHTQAEAADTHPKLAGPDLQFLAPPVQDGAVDAQAVLDVLIPSLKNFAFLLILGGLAIWLMPKRFLGWTNEARTHPYASTGYGFVIAIVGYVGSGVVAAMLLALAIGIVLAGFWEQALLLAMFSFSSLGLAFSIFLIFVYYGSKIIFSYLIGWLIISRLSPPSTRYRMLSLVLGLLIYEVLRLIPYFGIVFAVIVTFLGLGATWLAFIKMRRGELTANPLLNLPATGTENIPALEIDIANSEMGEEDPSSPAESTPAEQASAVVEETAAEPSAEEVDPPSKKKR